MRTVQRWERELALPVHRMQTRRGDTVYALTGELEAWRRSLDVSRLGSEWDSDDRAATTGAPARPRSRVVAGAVAASLVLGGFLLVIGARVVVPWLRPPGGQPAELRVDLDTLFVNDASGRRLWSHRFPAELDAVRYSAWRGIPGRRPLAAIRDLDGDGEREVVVLTFHRAFGAASALTCFSARGATKFEVPAPTHWVQFGTDRYGPPWVGHNLFITGSQDHPVLWAAWTHMASGNFPCVLQRLSSTGRVESEFWSAGYIESLTTGTLAGRPVIFVGATNNDHRGASLAAFDEGSVRGSVPAETEGKVCHGCPPGGPRAFVVFPQMEIDRLSEGFPTVQEVRQQEGGVLRVTVTHVAALAGEPFPAAVFYDLDSSLQPLRAEIGANYVAAHRQFEKNGWLDHPYGDRDRRDAWPVLAWKEGTGFVGRTGPTDR